MIPAIHRSLAPALAAALLAIAAPAAAQQVQIAELRPASVVTGSGDFTLTIVGSGFQPGVSRVTFGGRNMTAASVTPTEITVRITNDLITERVARDFQDDGIARAVVNVINGRGGPTDHPSARMTFRITKPGVAVVSRPPTPVINSVGPDVVPLDGTILVRGDYLDAPMLHVHLESRTPGARVSSHGLDDEMRRDRRTVRIRARNVPAGSYTLVIEARDTDGHTLGTTRHPVVVGSPTRLGPPTIASTGPSQLPRAGGTLTVNGDNFTDDVRVLLVTPDGRTQPLERAPNRESTRTQVVVLVPALQHVGTHTLRVENPGAGTPVAERELALVPPPSSAPRPGSGTELGGGSPAPAVQPRQPGRRPAPPARPSQPTESTEAAGVAVTVAIVANSNLCLVPDADRDRAQVHLKPCSDRHALFELDNGYVSTPGGRCLDFGAGGGPLHLMPCKPGRPDRSSQQWYFHGNKLAQNALDPAICMDVERERMGVGGRIIAHRCANYDSPVAHQRFYPGGVFPMTEVLAAARLPLDARFRVESALRNDGAAVFSNNARVISAGSGNVISAGGGNVISAGSGNVISAGGGNVISAGALNLRVVSEPGSLFRGASVISAGSGNVISAGSLNLIGGAGANLTPIPRP